MAKTYICIVGGEEFHGGHVPTADGDFVCSKHWKEIGFSGMVDAARYGGKVTTTQINTIVEQGLNAKEYMQGAGQSSSIPNDATFKPNFKVGTYLAADTNSKIVRINTKTISFKPNLAFAYNDLLNYNVFEDGDSVEKKHGVGRAVGGALLFGPVGGIVGAITGKKKTKKFVTDLHIDVTLKNHDQPSYSITLISSKTKPGMILDSTRKSAVQIAAFFDEILDSKNEVTTETQNANGDASASVADQLRELKSLADDGIITEEEFEAKKKQLLRL